MTCGAVKGNRPSVYVVMTIRTVRMGHIGISPKFRAVGQELFLVALLTVDLGVLATKGEVCLVVIKVFDFEALQVVTLLAIGT